MTNPDAWSFRPVVYRLYDKNDRLIYIGATHHLPMRMKFHEQRSWWNDLIGRIEYADYPTRDDALAAEAVAIQEEEPVYNVLHRQGRHRDFADWTDEDVQACRSWMDTNWRHIYTPLAVRDFVYGTPSQAVAA